MGLAGFLYKRSVKFVTSYTGMYKSPISAKFTDYTNTAWLKIVQIKLGILLDREAGWISFYRWLINHSVCIMKFRYIWDSRGNQKTDFMELVDLSIVWKFNPYSIYYMWAQTNGESSWNHPLSGMEHAMVDGTVWWQDTETTYRLVQQLGGWFSESWETSGLELQVWWIRTEQNLPKLCGQKRS